MQKRHFPWIDWLRFLAALMVVVCHARGYNWVEWGRLAAEDRTKLVQAFYLVTRPGREWVVVFFALSGFLVGGRALELAFQRTFNLKAYTIDRVTRIWLPLIPALIWSGLVGLYVGLPLTWLNFGGNLIALQGIFCDVFADNQPLWSLSYEVWLYALAGGIAALIARRGFAIAPALLIAVAGYLLLRQLPVFSNCWIIGAAAYFLLPWRKPPGLGLIGLLLMLTGLVISQIYVAVAANNSLFAPWMLRLPSQSNACLVLSLGTSLLLLDLAGRTPRSSWLIRLEALGTHLAAFSYTLYLTHYPVLRLWEHAIPDRFPAMTSYSLTIFLVKVASCLLFAWLLYLPFEAQTGRVKDWLKQKF